MGFSFLSLIFKCLLFFIFQPKCNCSFNLFSHSVVVSFFFIIIIERGVLGLTNLLHSTPSQPNFAFLILPVAKEWANSLSPLWHTEPTLEAAVSLCHSSASQLPILKFEFWPHVPTCWQTHKSVMRWPWFEVFIWSLHLDTSAILGSQGALSSKCDVEPITGWRVSPHDCVVLLLTTLSYKVK